MKEVNTYLWDDFGYRVGARLVRKAEICKDRALGTGGEFEGYTETDVVFAAGAVLEASGFDVYFEAPYPKAYDCPGTACDLLAQDIDRRNAYVEVKMLQGPRDLRLSPDRLRGFEFQKDLLSAQAVATHGGTGLLLLAATWPTCDLGEEANGLALRDVIVALSEGAGAPHASHFNLRTFFQTEHVRADLSALHVFSWCFRPGP